METVAAAVVVATKQPLATEGRVHMGKIALRGLHQRKLTWKQSCPHVQSLSVSTASRTKLRRSSEERSLRHLQMRTLTTESHARNVGASLCRKASNATRTSASALRRTPGAGASFKSSARSVAPTTSTCDLYVSV